MAKKFMYVCLGILALAVAFHVGAEYGEATIVDPSMIGIIASHREGSLAAVLLDDGQVWGFGSAGWSQSEYGLPVEPTEVKFYHGTYLVTYDNELWHLTTSEGWVNHGSPPTGSTLTHSTTWSRIKAEFGE